LDEVEAGRLWSLARSASLPDASLWRVGRGDRYAAATMSTRKLIFAALVCGLAILVAATVQLLQIG